MGENLGSSLSDCVCCMCSTGTIGGEGTKLYCGAANWHKDIFRHYRGFPVHPPTSVLTRLMECERKLWRDAFKLMLYEVYVYDLRMLFLLAAHHAVQYPTSYRGGGGVAIIPPTPLTHPPLYLTPSGVDCQCLYMVVH